MNNGLESRKQVYSTDVQETIHGLKSMKLNATNFFNNSSENTSTDGNSSSLCRGEGKCPHNEILIWTYVPPILLVFGTIGGVLTILVFARKNQRTNSSATFLLGLAVSDLLVLYSGLLRQWIRYVFDVDIRDLSQFLCKGNPFFVYFSLDVSSWILMALTLERLVLVWYPYRSKKYCTQQTTIIVIVILCICSTCLNFHILIGFGLEKFDDGNDDSYFCTSISDNYLSFFNGPWTWIDLVMFCVLPTIVLLVGNALIMIKLATLRRKRRRMTIKTTSLKPSSGRSQSHNSWKVTIIVLLVLDFWFFVCTAPISIILVTSSTRITSPRLHQPWAVSNMLMYANNTFNFALYCLSGSKFRHEVKEMFHQNCRLRNMKIANRDLYNSQIENPVGNELMTFESVSRFTTQRH